MSKTRRQTGFMLIEVLISILIFSVGVIALIGLQASMTRAQTDAKLRADASGLATELVGLMWGDIGNLANYDGATCASYTTCNMWLSKVGKTLPTGTPTVTVNTTAGNSQGDVSITIQWTMPNGDTHSYTMATNVRLATT